ncbi:MAG: indolepyruvate oxidoreductase subunit beta [Bacteroidia bacterium]|nr:indolepyruvate oxidoreductase subunit beta [Bacteroidia bacterium]
MKTDIILAGVGGQGILTIAAAIGFASLHEHKFVKQAEVHGMSQRGGAVQSHLRISDNPVFSDLIPLGTADLILSVEPMEALRYLPYLAINGWVVTNSVPFENITDYPSITRIQEELRALPNSVWLNADQFAKDCHSPKSSNIVMLGAASGYLGLGIDSLRVGVEQVFRRKGKDVVEANIRALEAGRKFITL